MTRKQCINGNCTRTQDRLGKGYCRVHAYANGTRDKRVTPHRAIAHLYYLTNEKGMSLNHIAHIIGMSCGSLTEIKNGKRKGIRSETEQKILGVTKASGFPQGFVASWPYARRIRALLSIGWSTAELSQEFGMSPGALLDQARGENASMKRATAAIIKTKYGAMSLRPVRQPSPAVARRNWPRPFDWENIDDPDEKHPTKSIRSKDMLPVTPVVIDTINFAIDALGGIQQFCEYFGVTDTTIYLMKNRKQTQININLWDRIRRFAYHKRKKAA